MRRMRRLADLKKVIDSLGKYRDELKSKNDSEEKTIEKAIEFFSQRSESNGGALPSHAAAMWNLDYLSALVDGGKFGEMNFPGISNMAELASSGELGNAIREEYADIRQGKYAVQNGKPGGLEDIGKFIEKGKTLIGNLDGSFQQLHYGLLNFHDQFKQRRGDSEANEWSAFTTAVYDEVKRFVNWADSFYKIINDYRSENVNLLEWRRNAASQYRNYLSETISNVKYYANELGKTIKWLKQNGSDEVFEGLFGQLQININAVFSSMKSAYDWIMS